MSCCITNPQVICQPVGTCADDELQINETGLSDGDYTVRLSFLDSTIELEASVEGGTLRFSTADLNENYTYEAILIDDEGQRISIGEYDGFQFTTKLSENV